MIGCAYIARFTCTVWDSRFVYAIPPSMSSLDAAPLLCVGWTVWNALSGYDLKPTNLISVIGIGGLGHLALQFANKMGCEITAFWVALRKKMMLWNLGQIISSSTLISNLGRTQSLPPR
jgi:D-arabinose 1-dehydrogenase-like Zn-dependent alcohol dehydrogenase